MNTKQKRKKIVVHASLIAIGKRLRKLRQLKQISVLDLAEKSCLGASTIYKLELGGFNVTILTLERLCDALDINLSSVIPGVNVDTTDLDLLNIIGIYNNLSKDKKSELLSLVNALSNEMGG